MNHDYEQAIAALPDALRDGVRRSLEDIERALDGEVPDGQPAAANQVVRLLASSDFAAGVLRRDANWFFGGREKVLRLPDHESLSRDIGGLPASTDSRKSFMRRLRRQRNRALLQILWHEVVEPVAVERSLVALTELAEVAVDAALAFARLALADRFGEPVFDDEPLPLVTLAMGKLGGRELNFSSDVDLIFLYPSEGETNGARQVTAHEYFARLTREAVALLEEVTADGFVYRVDTRLRPFGRSGPPVVSFAALESYLVEHGRGWERYAYVKARPITSSSDCRAARRLMSDIVGPFVYRRYLDYGVFESLRELHALISAEVARKEMAANVKLGPGGIREIEFIVQSLQLVRGGRAPELMTPSLREAMRAAVDDCDLTADEAERLIAAYDFLRRVENVLQGVADRQTHELPGDEAGRERIAFALDFSGWDELEKALRAAREFVSEQFRDIGIRDGEQPSSGGHGQDFENLWATRAGTEEWSAALAATGVTNADEVAALLAGFSRREAVRRIDATAAGRLKRFVAALASGLADRERPAIALERVLEVVEAVIRRSAYLALMNENPPVLKRLLELCESSSYLSGEIARYPVLLDELIDARIFVEAPTSDDIRAELDEALKGVALLDIEGQIEALAQFKRAITFRLAVADFSGSIPIMKVSDRLTEIAECVLEKALVVATAELERQFGTPRCIVEGEPREVGLGVIAYGKLAGFELSYSSDLDLVFIHDSRGQRQETSGERSIENPVFFSRLVRRLVHFLTTTTASGALYEIDMRLRPSGRSGLLVTSTEAFEKYQEENAWTWEHQALLRSRPVAGSRAVAVEFERVRSVTLRTRVHRDTLRQDVLDMRRKMRAQLDRTGAEGFDLKQGLGGIGDIEFLVQFLVLLNADRHPEVIEWPDNIRQLDALAAAGLLEKPVASRLQRIYQQYRALTHRLALDRQPALADPHAFTEERRFVGRAWEDVFGEPL